MLKSTYEADFLDWTEQQAALLRTHDFSNLDIENLLEEIEAMGRSEFSQLQNRLELLLVHLLKWQFQPSHQGASWRLTIRNNRRSIARLLKRSPSLKSKIDDEFLLDTWQSAVDEAAIQTGISDTTFPQSPIWTFEQILDQEFLP